MSRNLQGPVLQKRRYSEELQQQFADLSGDFNPMHVDAVAARRTLVGGRAVHGIHQTLAAIEVLLANLTRQKRPLPVLAGFKSNYLKPVQVGDVVALHRTKLTTDSCLITGRIQGEVVSRILVRFGENPLNVEESKLPALVTEPVVEMMTSEMAEYFGSLPLGLDESLSERLFPLTLHAVGPRRLAATLALSRLVGMRCPGLHSIFTDTDIAFVDEEKSAALDYRVESFEERFSRLDLAVSGGNLRGKLIAYVRPAPQAQPGMVDVKRVVESGSFSKSVALIIGGSRGLGEITAKIIAAGGGLPIVTYHQGAIDAEKVAADIRANGGRCEILPLDVRQGDKVVRRLLKSHPAVQSLYYFATPKIPGRQRGFFNHEMLRQFNEIYVTAFGRLIDAVAEHAVTKLRVFYPSSIMVTEGMDKMEEYIMAKTLAEQVCAFYNSNSPKIEIIVERVPRIKTDQTSSIIPLPALDALDVMLPLVRRMETGPTK